MSDIPTRNFNSEVTGVEMRNNELGNAAGEIFSAQEKDIFLKLPTPLITEAIAHTIKDLGQTDKNAILPKIVRKLTSSSNGVATVLSPICKELLDYVSEGTKRLTPFTGGGDNEYLSVAAGFIQGLKGIEQQDNSIYQTALEAFKTKVDKLTSGNPNHDEAMKFVKFVEDKAKGN